MLFLLACLSCATPLRAENLLDIYRLARQNDPTYLAAAAEYNAAKEASPKAWAAVLPQINLSGNHSEINQNQTFAGNTLSEPYHSNSYSLTLTQAIYRKQQFEQIREWRRPRPNSIMPSSI